MDSLQADRHQSSAQASVAFREPARGRHIATLDGVRGMAILLVMLSHWSVVQEYPGRLDRISGKLMGGGWIGVELFFVLSGFLITGILLDSVGRKRYFLDFYARRTFRIFPLYYLFLFVFLVLAKHLPAHGGGENLASLRAGQPSTWWYWAYCSNFLMARTGFVYALGVTWSLAIEEQFYWVWPFVVAFISRKTLIQLCWVLLAVCVAIRAGMSLCHIDYPAPYLVTPAHMDGLLIGALVACYARSPGGMMALKTPSAIAGILGGIAAVGATAIAWHGGLTVKEDPWTQIAIYTALAFAGGMILVFASLASPASLLGKFFSNTILRQLGKYSYAIYLFHQPINGAVRYLTKSRHWPVIAGSHLPQQIGEDLASAAIVFVVAWLSWHCFEMWFLKLKKFFPSPPPPIQTPQAAAQAGTEAAVPC